MNLLLDTHIWLWYLLGDDKLSPRLQTIIADPNHTLWLSPISIWETMLLAEKARINLQPTPERWINQALNILKTQEAPLNHKIAVLSRQIQLPHQDPADRFIAATAIYHDLTLVTVDRNLTGADGLSTIC
jgi:PIN domain nuclease of toxin-antitoxin system